MSAAMELKIDSPLPIISTNDSQGNAVDLDAPAIYVASLSDYNGGILHGRWISCCYGADHIQDEVNAILAASPHKAKYGDPAEEWAIHDYSGFEGIELSEWESFDHVCKLAEALEEHGEAFAAYYSYNSSSDLDDFQDVFCGIHDSEQDYASELADELIPHDAPNFLTRYFDYEAFARDLFCGDYYSVDVSGGVAVFRSY